MLPRSKITRVLLMVVPLLVSALGWNVARHRPRFVKTPVPAQALALSHDGERLAFSIQSEEVFWSEKGALFRLPTTQAFPGYPPSGAPPTLQFSHGGRALERTSKNNPQVFRWDLKTNRVRWSAIFSTSNYVTAWALSADGTRLAQRAFDIVRVLDVTGAGTPQKRVPGRSASIYARRFPVLFRQKIRPLTRPNLNPLISQIALWSDFGCGRAERNFAVLEGRNGPTPPLAGMAGKIGQFKISPDGRFVALCDDVGVALWNVKTARWTRGAPTSLTLHDLAWMPDSRSLWLSSFVVPVSDNDKVQQLSVPELKPVRVIPTWGPIAVSGDGRTLATRDNAQKGVWLWNLD